MSKQSEALKLVRDRLASMNHEDSIFAGEFNEEIKLLDEVIEQPAQPLTGLLSIARKHPEGRVVTVSFRTVEDAMAFEKYAIEAAHGTTKGGAP